MPKRKGQDAAETTAEAAVPKAPTGKRQRSRTAAIGSKSPAEAKSSAPSYYLLKSEPDEFSIRNLASRPDQTEPWDGVRSYQARNIMQGMRVADQCLFYHSNTKQPGVVGICEVVREAYPDSTALDAKSPKYDPKSLPDKPTWFMVDVKLVRELRRQVSLQELKQHSSMELEGMVLLSKGRLSVQPVTKQQWDFILQLAEEEPKEAS